MLKRTTAINKILALKKRIKIIQGGTSAGKTFGILPILIDKAAKTGGLEISVVAESIPHLRRGALRDFLKVMKWTNRFVDDRFNKSLLKYEFANGSFIEFFSADDSSKLRGARRDILYVNECNNVNFEAYNELSIRTKHEVYLDFNPANEFWVEEIKEDKEADFIILTYKDNEALDKGIVDQIEKNRLKAETSTIKGVTKGRDSINYGIDVMQRENYLVTSNSTNLIKELRSYCWDTDKTGKRLNKPIDNYNHAIDAVRYHEMETLGMNKNYGSYNVL